MKMNNLLVMVLSAFLVMQTATADVVREVTGAVFSELERQVIRDYYRDYRDHDDDKQGHKDKKKGKGKNGGLPPGLAKRDTLPPGLQRKYERYGHLPPGLEKKALPGDLMSRLPRRHHEFERVRVDNDILLIERASGIIADIIHDILN